MYSNYYNGQVSKGLVCCRPVIMCLQCSWAGVIECCDINMSHVFSENGFIERAKLKDVLVELGLESDQD